ncbi:unnamed protein product [Staurois parvus]|uniref:Uncharacterized protein n=1 Tax=Staurois parvus TaxID=386267 RepID=A0ABN9FNU9_9NEOB|nr:unnamed protein product [Staurois parvus]
MPPCGSDLLLLTWRVTRPFSARCFVPHCFHGYRLGWSDHALAHPSIHLALAYPPLHIRLSPCRNLWRIPLPRAGVLRGRDLVPVCSKSIPTIRGPGEQADCGLDSALWGILSCGLLEVPPGGC